MQLESEGYAEGDVPVIRYPNYCLCTFITHEFDLILNIKHRLAILHASHIPDRTEHSARVAFIAVFTQIGKLDPFLALPIHRRRPFKVVLAPTLSTPVQAIGTVVGRQWVCPAVEAQSSILNPICSATNSLAKVWCIVRLVQFCGRKAKDDVLISDEELLDCGTLGQKSEG